MNETAYPTIILGGGFVGLFTALHLSHQHYKVPTLLIDQEWSFTFKPLLYEFLSGELNSQLIVARYDDLLKHSGVAFVKDNITNIDLLQKRVQLASGLKYSYQNLVLALGSVAGYFNIEGAQENTFAFRTPWDVTSLGRHMRDCLQMASQIDDCDRRRQLLTFAILGAGRSGIELAVTLADLLAEWYAPLRGDAKDIRIIVVQRGSEILKGDADKIRQTALAALHQRSVKVELLLEAEVKAVRSGKVEILRHGCVETLSAQTIIWTTGSIANPLIKTLPVKQENYARNGSLHVTSTLQLPDFPEVFAGGDCAVHAENPLPATAQVAYQQGAAIAYNLKALNEGREPHPANIRLRGTLMKSGLAESIAEIFDRVEVRGKLGHLVRQAAYIELLPTPARNFKATAQWLSDEVFHRIAGV